MINELTSFDEPEGDSDALPLAEVNNPKVLTTQPRRADRRSLGRRVRKSAASTTGLHHFFSGKPVCDADDAAALASVTMPCINRKADTAPKLRKTQSSVAP